MLDQPDAFVEQGLGGVAKQRPTQRLSVFLVKNSVSKANRTRPKDNFGVGVRQRITRSHCPFLEPLSRSSRREEALFVLWKGSRGERAKRRNPSGIGRGRLRYIRRA